MHTLRIVFKAKKKDVLVAFLVFSSFSIFESAPSVFIISASISIMVSSYSRLDSYFSASSAFLPSLSACKRGKKVQS